MGNWPARHDLSCWQGRKTPTQTNKIKYHIPSGLDNAAFVTSEIHRIEERRDLKIECNVSRSPELTVVWKKYNDEGFIVNGTELDLRNISRNESGGYLCYSYNVTYDTEPRAAEVHRYTVGVLCKLLTLHALFSFTPFLMHIH